MKCRTLEVHRGTTIREIDNAKPRAKKYKLSDGDGLCLLVLPSLGKLWLWRYCFEGTEKNMLFWEYPFVTLKDARELHFTAKKVLGTGINPMAERKAEFEAKLGYRDRMTGHGFRGLASTIFNENGFEEAHIELQLAHMKRDKVAAAYNHAKYLKQRTAMMQWWANYLDAQMAKARKALAA